MAEASIAAAIPTGSARPEAELRSSTVMAPDAPSAKPGPLPETPTSSLPPAAAAQKLPLGSGAPVMSFGPERAKPASVRSVAPAAMTASAERPTPAGSKAAALAGSKARSGPAYSEAVADARLWALKDDAMSAKDTPEAGGFQVSPLAHPLGEGGPAVAVPSGADEAPRTARHIARQVADQPVLRSGGAAELSLAPEELGQLRLRVEIEDGGLRILIEAARPDTADLMRRHVETLRQELRSEGLGSVSVSIGGGGQERGGAAGQGRDPGPGRGATWPGLPVPDADLAPRPSRPRNVAGHLDLRF